MMEWLVGLAMVFLVCLSVYQQRFYSKIIKDLVDRLMARDLREYEQVKNPPPPRIVVKNEPPVEDLNRILG